MVTIEEISQFGKKLDVVTNRCKVINQMLGFTKDGSSENPMRLVMDHGEYHVVLRGCEVVTFGVYDLDGIERAIAHLDGMGDGIWCSLREGLLMVA